MSWMKTLNEMHLKDQQNIDDLLKESNSAKSEDVGFINRKTGAGILARNNGNIEAFAGLGLGFRFDPEHRTLSVFAPTIQLFTQGVKTFDGTTPLNPINNDYQEILQLIGGKVDEEI